jgi:dephospho-CoA kinase
MAVPSGMMEKALRGMEVLYRRGVRYPISFAGAEADSATLFPQSYSHLEDLGNRIKERGNFLLLGVTGGIASGKTTVVHMLKDLGAYLIDFDVIARQVVEPEKPAWKEIVDYFGRQVLQEDGSLDRKSLSEVVFQDMEKRKKLEGFTHPRIFDEFFKQVNEITDGDPDAIILADVPLLIELNTQYMFHKILVVYAPEEMQIERLAARDGISKDQAAHMLKSQLPIDEKVGYADFVIYNDKPLEEVRKQVEELWETLKKVQEEKE